MLYKAILFAKVCHEDQVRKYTKQPYFVHPMRVANLAMGYDVEEYVLAAAYLHDVMEDCDVTYEDLVRIFNKDVADLVRELTNVSKVEFPNSNREQRKKMDMERLAGVSRNAKLLKLLDRYDNINDIPFTEDFAPKYAKETLELLTVLTGVDDVIHAKIVDKCQSIMLNNKLYIQSGGA